MTTLTINNINFDINFDEEVEGTYVVAVTATTDDAATEFFVNCQNGLAYDYKESKYLSCSNQSGGDISDSGLSRFLDENGIDVGSDEYDKIVEAIDAEAQAQISILTVDEYICDMLDNDYRFEKVLAGACYATDCSLSKYVSDDGKVVVVAEDSSENTPENIVQKFREFETNDEYKTWFDDATKEHTGNWSGDFGLALMLYKAL